MTFRVMQRDECGTVSCLENQVAKWEKDERHTFWTNHVNEEIQGVWLEEECLHVDADYSDEDYW